MTKPDDDRIAALRADTVEAILEFRRDFWPVYQAQGFTFPVAFCADVLMTMLDEFRHLSHTLRSPERDEREPWQQSDDDDLPIFPE